ncbi:MAG: glycosyltransferase family 39 protein [Pseudorhodoplanes sp.]
MLVSVIVPTLNEVGNIDALVTALLAEASSGLKFEILIADGGSTDGTVELVRKWEAAANVRLVAGDGERGLAGDVLTAAAAARGDVVVVMDADLSHPPDRVCALVQPVLDGSSDMVVGSRFVAGGATPGWPIWRFTLSRLGSLLAWPLTEVKDTMSGFFAVRRERLLAIDPQAAGFKIGLEVIAHGGGALRVSVVPIVFPDRIHGESKIGKAQMMAYLRRLLVLAGGAVSASGAARFAAVGLIGMFVDLLMFEALFAASVPLMIAHVASFCAATVSNYFLNSRWAFAESWRADQGRTKHHYRRFLTVCLLALAIRGGVLVAASGIFGMQPQLAIFFAIGTAAIINYLGSAFFVFPSLNPRVPYDIRWRVTAIGVVGYVVVLRLLFIGLVDLLPQEAYYWNYSQHLDFGYLDHPPMVAWLIWVGTSVFGNNEFGIRIAASLGWFATAFFSFRLTHHLFGKSAAFVSLLLVATLPFYFASGFFMTPDAPLTVAWAGALFFLERALIGSRRNAWCGVGICIGLGMLSKYTIALLGPAMLLFMLIDKQAREWLKRPEPYFAAVLALLIFSPVIYWNLVNGLASFAFQSTRRMEGMFQFSLPILIFHASALLTPPGLIAALAALWAQCRRAAAIPTDDRLQRISRFIAIFTLVPLAVFVAFSLSRGVKLNWTGPLWLAVLPAMSTAIVAVARRSSAFELRIRRAWGATVAISVVFYGIALNYLVLGIPGVGYVVSLPGTPVAWSEFGREAATIEREVKQATGAEPLMIGLDTYNVASQLAFYVKANGKGVMSSVGRGILGQNSLMYDYWFRPSSLHGRPAVMFAFKRYQIDDPALANHFTSLSAPMERVVTKGGKPARRFYYRIGYDFRGAGTRASSISAHAIALSSPPCRSRC